MQHLKQSLINTASSELVPTDNY